jgi:tetratricopeptide (TPR) repeat protein
MEQVEEKEGTKIAALENLSRRLHDPSVLSTASATESESPEGALSFIPWKLNIIDGNTRELQDAFPSFSYLDLRREQNIAWATDRLAEGNALLFEDPQQAENSYIQGLDLVPDHVELLVAHGKLLAQSKRIALAIIKFQRALEVDLECASAKENLERVQTQQARLRHQFSRTISASASAPVARESSMLQDVLLERALLMEDSTTRLDDEEDKKDEEDDVVQHDDKHSRKHRKKHKKQKRSRSPSTSYSSSSEDSCGKRKKSKRSRASSHSPSLSSSDDDSSSREDRRRRRKHRKHSRSKRKHEKRKRRNDES